MGRASIEAVLELSARQIAGPPQQGKHRPGDILWHGVQRGRVFLKDRKLDVAKTVEKIRSYQAWRSRGFACLTAADVAAEAATGKARLLAERDVLGRPAVLVKVASNRLDTRVLAVRLPPACCSPGSDVWRRRRSGSQCF
jgi:hypothetical protein